MNTFLTYDCQLRVETDPTVIETLTRKGWVEAPQPPYDPTTQTCTWQDCQWVVGPIIVPVPQLIPNWSLRAQLQIMGLFDDVQTMIDNLTGDIILQLEALEASLVHFTAAERASSQSIPLDPPS